MVQSTVIGIIKNEKYKGDLLLGKTFTVDPISKRRLENFGEEDKFYIRNHHEPIISEEVLKKHKKFFPEEMLIEERLERVTQREKNIVGNMLSVVCWNVVSVVAL
mgnify:CR=1 FL=1